SSEKCRQAMSPGSRSKIQTTLDTVLGLPWSVEIKPSIYTEFSGQSKPRISGFANPPALNSPASKKLRRRQSKEGSMYGTNISERSPSYITGRRLVPSLYVTVEITVPTR